jgi:hypothetical protein
MPEVRLFFSLFSEVFFGKRPRTVQRPKGGVPQVPKNTRKKALIKTAVPRAGRVIYILRIY